MNEQDIINKINDTTKNIPIPDSISPDNIKKMLDEQINETTKPHSNIHTDVPQSSSTVGKKSRTIRRFTTAACITLCLIGGIAAHQLNPNIHLESAKDAAIISDETYGEIEKDNGTAAEEVVEEACDAGEDTTDDMVYQNSLQSPSDYDNYYNTLKSAYDYYYDNIATVTKEEAEYNEWLDAHSEAQLSDKLTVWDQDVVSEAADSDIVYNFSAMRGDSVEFKEAVPNDDMTNNKSESSKEFSTTNTQESMVDEGDIVKTDGTYIYKLVSRTHGDYEYKFTITETDNGALKVLANIDLMELAEGNQDLYIEFHEFYLYANYILIMYTTEDYSTDISVTETNIVIYDIKDKENPRKIRTLTQSGWYESSRISDGFLYTISNFHKASLDTPTPYTNYIPSINGNLIDCENIFYPKDILMNNTCVITSLNLKSPTDFSDTKAIPTQSGQIYVSSTSIYIYSTLYDEVQKTEITKIRYDKGVITPGESSIITGYLYGSFALSEHNKHLRIVATIPANNISMLRFTGDATIKTSADVTTSKDIKIKEDVNVLYILDDNMNLTGKLSGIAPGEQIYSARFMGDIGYFVTFKQVDPLFSVDLSDPANPKILGALKIPGFSNYLHFYDDNLLWGFGEEIEEKTSDFLGLKLSMFDISDPANVIEQDKYIIENSAYSNAQYNHKAIMIDTEKNIIGFLYETDEETSTDYYESNYYYATYTYDAKKGFIETARYTIPNDSEYEADGIRGLYIGDYFYLTSDMDITSYEIGSTKPIAQVYFE